MTIFLRVIPAEAGIYIILDSRLRGNDRLIEYIIKNAPKAYSVYLWRIFYAI